MLVSEVGGRAGRRHVGPIKCNFVYTQEWLALTGINTLP